MANGRPVISTAVGGVVDVLGAIEKSETGYAIRERGISVASDDEVGFAAGLQRLLNDSELRRRFAERGKVFVETAHSKERLIADTARVYREFFSKPELDI
jgi:glycosyltransferase involved in cell wall biosynthesis